MIGLIFFGGLPSPDAHIGSDHTPLLLDDRMDQDRPPARFQFDASWLLVEGFIDMLASKITLLLSSNARSFGPLDD